MNELTEKQQIICKRIASSSMHIYMYGSLQSCKEIIHVIFSDMYKTHSNYIQHVHTIDGSFMQCGQFKEIENELYYFLRKYTAGLLQKSVVIYNAHYIPIDFQGTLRQYVELNFNTVRFYFMGREKNVIAPLLSRLSCIHVP